jgi:hypothetical protein
LLSFGGGAGAAPGGAVAALAAMAVIQSATKSPAIGDFTSFPIFGLGRAS